MKALWIVSHRKCLIYQLILCFREWLLNFLPQLFDPDFVLEPGVVRYSWPWFWLLRTLRLGTGPMGSWFTWTGSTFPELGGSTGSPIGLEGRRERGFQDLVISSSLDFCLLISRLRLMGDTHVRASFDHVVGSNYMGSHWWALARKNLLKTSKKLSSKYFSWFVQAGHLSTSRSGAESLRWRAHYDTSFCIPLHVICVFFMFRS